MTREEAKREILFAKREVMADSWIDKAYDVAIKALEQPEIIRCKECMNHGKEICYFWSHFYGTINTPDDGFCHKAERRTDD